MIQNNSLFQNSIGIIGCGFVGNAICKSFNLIEVVKEIVVIDTDLSKNTGTYEDIKKCDAVFICVPSPQNSDGSCDSSLLEDVLKNLKGYKGVIISKVTATPDVYQRLQKDLINLVYVPEFLTAANANVDYLNTKKFIIGGSVVAYLREAERILKLSHPSADFYFTDIKSASMVKYIINSFLATKVVFMNEIQSLSNSIGCEWQEISQLLKTDHRIGNSHLQVPGPDGFYGFGGMCFPKDTSAFIKYAETQNQSLNVLKEAVKKNTLIRLTKPK